MLKYRGGKSKEIPHIMEHVPDFNGRYIEPFLGGGAVFFHLEPEQAIINDINAPLMAFYRGVRDDYQKRELNHFIDLMAGEKDPSAGFDHAGVGGKEIQRRRERSGGRARQKQKCARKGEREKA